ncbi:flavodoxin domain-containing protein [Sulfitobacter sp. D35]|uniref:flavodoxin domain-containing protein n=1 Tax=Sulfitobacter sp. D35 TaxID=3083252 RepID=UPI00296FB731|nr:flavodoxin domain-containing protein [Sulfitobacter sp. D35]MDW4496795.1 flavodoxin domain-containing protein [Sulfitobacter sp. D35]
MTVLIVFATVEGQTGKIADAVARTVRDTGRQAVLFDTAKRTAPVSFEGVRQVILAAPVHERRHPETFEVFLAAHRASLAMCETLMLSVSLSASFEEGLEEAEEYVTEMAMRTGLTPDETMLVAGAIRSDRYDYFSQQVLRHVVLRDRDVDPGGPHEFTDWAALASAVTRFVGAEDAVTPGA